MSLVFKLLLRGILLFAANIFQKTQACSLSNVSHVNLTRNRVLIVSFHIQEVLRELFMMKQFIVKTPVDSVPEN